MEHLLSDGGCLEPRSISLGSLLRERPGWGAEVPEYRATKGSCSLPHPLLAPSPSRRHSAPHRSAGQLRRGDLELQVANGGEKRQFGVGALPEAVRVFPPKATARLGQGGVRSWGMQQAWDRGTESRATAAERLFAKFPEQSSPSSGSRRGGAGAPGAAPWLRPSEGGARRVGVR